MNGFEKYTLKLAAAEEAPIAMAFIDEAKRFLKSKGVDQWQNGYPGRGRIEQDIALGNGYFLMEGQEYLAYLCIDLGGEPAYDGLNGSWLGDHAYGVVHRLAIGDRYKGRGLASVSFDLAAKRMAERGAKSFRIDTDGDNEIMKHLLSKNGFTYCGTIWFDNSVKIAYEKLL